MNRPKTKIPDVSVRKFRITSEMVGGECLLVTDGRGDEIQAGVEYAATLSRVTENRERSYEQLKLYWSCCGYVAENNDDMNWNTKEKVDEQVKIAARHYEYWIYYQNQKTGEKTLNVKTKSISFAELPHLEACGFFDDAFKILACKIGLTVEELIEAVTEGVA